MRYSTRFVWGDDEWTVILEDEYGLAEAKMTFRQWVELSATQEAIARNTPELRKEHQSRLLGHRRVIDRYEAPGDEPIPPAKPPDRSPKS